MAGGDSISLPGSQPENAGSANPDTFARLQQPELSQNRLAKILTAIAVGSHVSFKGIVPKTGAVLASMIAIATAGAPNLRNDLSVSNTNAMVETLLGNVPEIDMRQATPRLAFNYMEDAFAVGNGLYKETHEGEYGSIWAHSRVLSALSVAELIPGPDQDRYKDRFQKVQGALDSYWGGDKFGRPNGYYPSPLEFHSEAYSRYDDDEAWMGLISMNDFSRTHNRDDLQRAQKIFSFGISQWDKNDGGIYWEEQQPGALTDYRALVSNATYVSLGAQLYRATGNTKYLETSENIFNWISANLFDVKTGLYNDHIYSDGSIDHHKRTYVEASMVRAMAELSVSSPNAYDLGGAVSLAEQSLDYFKSHSTYGVPQFDAQCFRDLLWVAGKARSPAFTEQVLAGLKLAIRRLPNKPTHLITAAGAAQLVALPSLPQSEYGKL